MTPPGTSTITPRATQTHCGHTGGQHPVPCSPQSSQLASSVTAANAPVALPTTKKSMKRAARRCTRNV